MFELRNHVVCNLKLAVFEAKPSYRVNAARPLTLMADWVYE